jgi:hypothetical protein
VVDRIQLAAEKEETRSSSLAVDLSVMQREIQKMAAASPQIMLFRLTEEWGSVPDASFYQEMEMEKKRWMLSALYSLYHTPVIDASKERRNNAGERKVIALFEPKGAHIMLFIYISKPH